MKDRPKVIWGAIVNMAGLYANKPVRLRWKDNEFEDGKGDWRSADGNFDADTIGLSGDGWCYTFTSESKREVECFIAGAKAVMNRLLCFAGVDPNEHP